MVQWTSPNTNWPITGAVVVFNKLSAGTEPVGVDHLGAATTCWPFLPGYTEYSVDMLTTTRT